jgi:peptidoglycan hydrolase CwlO-like protein
MESTEQWQYEAVPAPADEGDMQHGTFAGVATALQDHSARLSQLAEACRAEAHELAEREARVNEREQAVSEAFADLDRRRMELDTWKRELDEAAARAAEAEARIAEAAERETALRALAESVVARYSSVSDG